MKSILPMVLMFCSAVSLKAGPDYQWYRDSWIQTHISLTFPEPRRSGDPHQTAAAMQFFIHQADTVRPDSIKFHTHDLWLIQTSSEMKLPERFGFSQVATINRAGSWYPQYDDDDRFVYRVNADGSMAGRWSSKHLCFNSPAVDEVIIPDYYIGVTKQVKPAQVWVDESLITVNVCYCPHCVRLYKEQTGQAPPVELTNDNFEQWVQWVGFHRQVFADWMAKVTRAVQSVDPSILVSFNASYMLSQPEPAPDFIKNLSHDIHKDSLEIGLFSRFGGSSGLPFDILPGLGQDIWAGIKPKTTEQVLNDISLIIAHGGIWQIGEFPTSFNLLRHEPKYQGDGYRRADIYLELAREGTEFARARQPYCQHTESAPNVAILHSASTHYAHVIYNLAGQGRGESFGITSDGHRVDNVDEINSRIYWPNNNAMASDIIGAYMTLLESQIHFDLLYEEQFQDNYEAYQMLILPEQAFLQEATKASIRRFVRQGGRVIASGSTLLAGLEDVLGVEPISRKPQRPAEINLGGHALAASLFWGVQTAGADVIGTSSADNRPGVTLNSFGSGKAIYIAGNVFQDYYHRSGYAYRPRGNHAAAHGFIDALLGHAQLNYTVRVQSPMWFEFVHRVQGDRILLNFINRKMNWKYPTDETGNINVKIRLDAEPASIRLQPGDESIGTLWEDGRLFFSLSPEQIKFHRIVEIQP